MKRLRVTSGCTFRHRSRRPLAGVECRGLLHRSLIRAISHSSLADICLSLAQPQNLNRRASFLIHPKGPPAIRCVHAKASAVLHAWYA
jgi:hypothetical protein